MRLRLAACAACLPAAAVESLPAKIHYVIVSPDGATVAEYTAIQSTIAEGEEYPFVKRVLYKDDAGRLLVIRQNEESPERSTARFTCLATGETIELGREPQSVMTIRFGTHVVRIDGSTLDPN